MNTEELAGWLVKLPDYDKDGVVIKQATVSKHDAEWSVIRALANPQRPDRSLLPGDYTQLLIDGALWMSDTPAEIMDLMGVDDAMGHFRDGSSLIVGLGIGLVLKRAIVQHGHRWIDVVELDQRIIDAIGPYYQAMATERGITLNFHSADIYDWEPSQPHWDVVWFDIWETIDMDDLAEVQVLEGRFSPHAEWIGSWAQDERLGQAHRIATKTGFY